MRPADREPTNTMEMQGLFKLSYRRFLGSLSREGLSHLDILHNGVGDSLKNKVLFTRTLC